MSILHEFHPFLYSQKPEVFHSGLLAINFNYLIVTVAPAATDEADVTKPAA